MVRFRLEGTLLFLPPALRRVMEYKRYHPFTHRDETQQDWAFGCLDVGWDSGERRGRKRLPRGNPAYCPSVMGDSTFLTSYHLGVIRGFLLTCMLSSGILFHRK
jgi:hypothetical protein